MIRFVVEDRNGDRKNVEVPEDINLSLMDVLKASGYNISAACGGMALCATCHVVVIKNANLLLATNEVEAFLLDTLPDVAATSRLACQLKIGPEMEGAVFHIRE